MLKILNNLYIKIRCIIKKREVIKMSDLLEWARKEIELLKKNNAAEDTDTFFDDYVDACYDSALKAFGSLTEDGHSGMSIGFTQGILNRLIDGKCLTPIEDIDNEWRVITSHNASCKRYRSIRQSSLLKRVFDDGAVQ